jgi:hypothetical protein
MRMVWHLESSRIQPRKFLEMVIFAVMIPVPSEVAIGLECIWKFNHCLPRHGCVMDITYMPLYLQGSPNGSLRTMSGIDGCKRFSKKVAFHYIQT